VPRLANPSRDCNRRPARPLHAPQSDGGPEYVGIHQGGTADGVMSHAAKSIKIEDIEARPSELERAVEAWRRR
jgi:hypothetical protein